MAVLFFVLAFIFRLIRYSLNILDPCLCYINIRLVSTPSTVEELLEKVRSRFGSLPTLASNRDWRERIQDALDALKGKETTPFGRLLACENLISRIRALECFETIPRRFHEVLTVPIDRPIFILGLPRTGTTILHRLLVRYPEVAHLNPVRCQLGDLRPQDVAEATSISDLCCCFDTTSSKIKYGSDLLYASGCGIPYNVHPANMTLPEECILLLSQYLFYVSYPYSRWKEFTDVVEGYRDLARQAYKFFRRDLQVVKSIVQLSGSRFVLKSAFHSCFIEEILDVFPDASFVRLHRDPVSVVPSASSLHRAVRAPFSTGDDWKKIGEGSKKMVQCISQYLVKEARRQAEHTLDFKFEELTKDPIGVCREIANKFGLEHTKAVEDDLAAFLAEDARKRDQAGGKHKHTLAEFGLDAEEIRNDCRDYCKKFGV
ncbi:omega-hydroxy-beta-dihydromenaquinone-9 sulfotransferase Stf3-like [Oscarella lobularis]|uniref:omega-hydroxy-beta-dihydromenaquinone-9 sulfotransferase Stf3-like n=1 Tax=Oscarella lobularis TaxID=121494 RepID=UPI003313CE15